MNEFHESPGTWRPLVYICSPYADDPEGNTAKARKYSRFAVNEGCIPLAPHLLLPQYMEEETERELAMYMNKVILSKCEEVWVFSERLTAGKDAFKQAIMCLDKNATVSFSGKHFVLTGFGSYESEVIAEIEKHGGKIHSSMVKMADYLVVCLESPGIAKVKKALEWRQKGVTNLIVSDYQMWQAIFGKTSIVSNEITRKFAPSTEATKKAAFESGSTSSTTARRRTQSSQLTELENSVNSTASELSQASDKPLTVEERKEVQPQPNADAKTNPNAKRIKELEESITALQQEADSIGGLFGFVKRNKIKKEIEAQQRELDSLKRRM